MNIFGASPYIKCGQKNISGYKKPLRYSPIGESSSMYVSSPPGAAGITKVGLEFGTGDIKLMLCKLHDAFSEGSSCVLKCPMTLSNKSPTMVRGDTCKQYVISRCEMKIRSMVLEFGGGKS